MIHFSKWYRNYTIVWLRQVPVLAAGYQSESPCISPRLFPRSADSAVFVAHFIRFAKTVFPFR